MHHKGSKTVHRTLLGLCCGPVAKAVGVVMTLSKGNATAFAEPAALTPDSELRLGPPLLSPHQAYPRYLAGIFTGVLKNALPWAESWIGQIMGACAWLQVALLSGYQRTDAMRAMHRAVACAYASSPHAH